jgi:hypothetical protein
MKLSHLLPIFIVCFNYIVRSGSSTKLPDLSQNRPFEIQPADELMKKQRFCEPSGESQAEVDSPEIDAARFWKFLHCPGEGEVGDNRPGEAANAAVQPVPEELPMEAS